MNCWTPSVGTDRLNIRDEIPGRVALNRSMGPRPPTTALIKQHDTVDSRVEIPPHRRATTTPRPAMQDNNGDTRGVAALLNIDAVALPNLHHPLVERVDLRIEIICRTF